MRLLAHPNIHEITVEGILYALADPVRAQILLQLTESTCAQNCASFLQIKDTPLPKSTLSQHLRILREAGLIRSERKGVEMHNTPRCAELKERFGSLIDSILKAYRAQSEPKRRKRSSQH